jgi:O-acetylhomoserine (thiol)-lyase
MNTKRKFGFETRMVHAGHIPDKETGARAVPIYQTSSYVFESADQAAQLFDLKGYGNIYTRLSNPTTSVLEERVASLEGATGALATSSGMAAQFVAFMTLLQPGDEIVASSHLYGGTVTQLVHTLQKLSINVHLVEPGKIENWEKAITPKTRALYGETVGNPRGSVLDIETLAKLANSKRIPLIVDNTFASPYLCRPIEWGATLVLHSATKFIGGHGNSLGGIICDSGNFDFSHYPTIAAPSPAYHNLRFYDTFGHYGFLMKARVETVRDVGSCLSPMNAFLLLQGVETLSLRMDRHVANAQKVAEFLKANPLVEWVAYAGLPDHPDYALAKKYLPKGPGAVFSFGIKAGACGDARAAGKKFIESLQIFSHLANVGDVRSLIIHPASTTHQQLSDEELRLCGVNPEMIRLSIGLENTEDLIWDLEQAFHAISH